MQLCVNSVQKWVSENGFKFSTSKTVCIHFHQQYVFFPDPNILLGKTPIKVVKEAKFLGLIFDTKLTFKNHIKYLKTSSQKALDILRVVGHTDWGADRIILLLLYHSLVRSKLDYGCIVYRSARRSILKQLDPIVLGVFRTSPAQSLYIEAHEPSLTTRRLKLSLNYVLKLKSLPENPAYSCVFEPENTKCFEAAESKVPPLGICIIPHLEKSKLNLNLVDDASPLDIIPWKLSVPVDRFDLTSFKKDTTNLEIYKQLYLQLISEYLLSKKKITDGSKTEDRVAAAAVSTKRINKPFTCRLPDDSSVYTAELRAILLALKYVYYSKGKSFLILSDSLSSLQSIFNLKYDHPALVQILDLYTEVTRDGRDIVFIWVPGHVGIRGNSAADSAGKDALDGDISVELIPFSDLKSRTNKYILELWQSEWDEFPENKLYKIFPILKECIVCPQRNRKEETVMARLHIGHSFITHSFLLKGEEPPVCIGCDKRLTVEHILLTCSDFIDIRESHFTAKSLRMLFQDILPEKIFNFLKEINIFGKI